MNQKEFKRVLEAEPIRCIFTKESIKQSSDAFQSGHYNSTDVRIAMGRVYTTKEYEAMRKKVLSERLP
jgi:hypothetical protein